MSNCCDMKRLIILLIATFTLTACGAGKAAMDAGKSFDRYACMSKNIKGEQPCSGSPEPATMPSNTN